MKTFIALFFSILLVNLFKPSQSTFESLINELQERSENVFILQKQPIQSTTTSEAEPATATGNNLPVITVPIPIAVNKGNSKAISSVYSSKRKKSSNKKNDGLDEGNVKLISSLEGNYEDVKRTISLNEFGNSNIMKPMALVWDDCFETNFKDNYMHLLKTNPDYKGDTQQLPTANDGRLKSVSGENIYKRDVKLPNNTAAVKAWIERYNSLKNAKSEERKQQKQDSVFLKRNNESISTTNMPTTMVKIIPITKNIYFEPTEPLKTKLDMGVTENNMKFSYSYTEDWFEPKDRTKIRFGGLPQKENYLIPLLKLEEGFYPFSFMSEFFSFIYPFDFPVGLIKDIVWGKFSFPYSFLQVIKVESAFLFFIITFACISLVIPAYLLILGILSLLSKSTCEDEIEAGALYPVQEETSCNDKALIVFSLLVVLMCCTLLLGMAISNEQARAAVTQSRSVVNCACSDVATWLAVAARDLHHSLVPPVDLVLQAYKDDLNNIESLLGEPIQQAISSESGIDLVLESLTDIINESEDLATKISVLRDVSVRAGSLATAASDRIKDLARQLEYLKKYCTSKDAPLCDTINTNSLLIQMKFELILHEQQLLELRTLGVENLTRAISSAKQEFRTLPAAVSTQTVQVRKDVIQDVENRRKSVHSSARILNDIVRHLTAGLHSVTKKLERGLKRVDEYEFRRWVVMLACIITSGVAIFLILMSMLCGCGRAKEHAKRTLQTSTMWICFTSVILWAIISASFLLAGHAEIYVCHALWDTPQYEVLEALLDKPSPLLENDEGVFDALFKDLKNVTIDVSVKDVLRECEKDQPAYVVFQLDKILDVNKETSYFEWEELQADLGRLASSVDVGFLKSMTVNFSRLLNKMLIVSNVDLPKHRLNYNDPVVGKDLPSLADQLENIAAQLTDLTTAGRLESLATRTHRLHLTNIKPLEQLRADLVFKLTELELQLMPFRRKLNISLSHIHTAQYYIDNQGEVIAQKKVSIFVSRLVSHAAGWRTHVLTSTGKQAARCRPLFSVYSAARALLCTRYISSLHGWWVCGLILGILWCVALTPLNVKLWRFYGRKIKTEEALILANIGSGLQETPTTALCDSSHWSIPGPPPPPRSDSW